MWVFSIYMNLHLDPPSAPLRLPIFMLLYIQWAVHLPRMFYIMAVLFAFNSYHNMNSLAFVFGRIIQYCPFIPSFFASSNLFPGLYQLSGTPRFPRNPCCFTEYFLTSGKADLVLLRRRFTILWTIYVRNKMNSKYQNDRYGQGWDWEEVSEAPRMQYLTRNLQNPRSECFLKFCTLGASLVSP